MIPLGAQTWRPSGTPLVVEIYSTGRANLPGASSYERLVEGFLPCVAELRKYSSAPVEADTVADAEDVDANARVNAQCDSDAGDIDDLFATFG